jgi:hypothetical protein
MAGIRDGRDEARYLGGCWWWWRKSDLLGESGWEVLQVLYISETAADFGQDAPERWGAAAAKDNANGNNQKLRENVRKDDSQVGVIDESPETRADVVNVLEYVLHRMVDSDVPDLDQVKDQRDAEVDTRDFVQPTIRARSGGALVMRING